MKGFIEVVESKSRQRASTICININDISCFFEIYDQENKKYRTSILIKNQRFGFVDADETYEEIKKKIEESQEEQNERNKI